MQIPNHSKTNDAKPLQSHVPARVSVDIHAASNVLAMVLPLCLQRSEGDGTCLPPVGWYLDDCHRADGFTHIPKEIKNDKCLARS